MDRIRELEGAIREAESLGRDALALRLRYELARLTISRSHGWSFTCRLI